MSATEADMLRLLATRYAAPAWAFLRHVADGTGWKKGRTLDAMAMSLWPSRGLHLHGFEVKVSRGDWQRELADPAKADGFARHCHTFWLVAPKDVVKPGELPPTWGLLVPRGKGLHVEREAPTQDRPPLPWDMLAAFLRGVCKAQEGMIPRSEIAAEIAAARVDGQRKAEELVRLTDTGRALESLQKNVAAFEAVSGVKIADYHGERIGKAVRSVVRDRDAAERARRQLEWARQQAEHALQAINDALGAPPEGA